ncbi:sialic acid-binding Ig-like lectin 8 isoform X2 [Polypterus senegalus]|uniref:sialic acid-binding Ig-like lectin 8 isoform X2 n=1 Tax=Polypterus senegalus TaxID=55291 RepID=UPI001965997C|nr:sialic acid-binding Ig-like lectin 8 isoform X2 [Polypterus senegalus]
MSFTETTVLLFGLIQGVLCAEWSVQMPQIIKAVNGSCVVIPCTFSVPDGQTGGGSRTVASWRRNSTTGQTLRTSGGDKKGQLPLVEVIGDMSANNCTSVMRETRKRHSDLYFFRTEYFNYTYPTGVFINITGSPDKPVISPLAEVQEGTSVNVTCTVPIPCPSESPELKWHNVLNGTVTQEHVMNADGTASLSSVLTFVASPEHHKRITCSVDYGGRNQSRSSTVKVQRRITGTKKAHLPISAIVGSLMCVLCLLVLVCLVKDFKSKKNKTEEQRRKADVTGDEQVGESAYETLNRTDEPSEYQTIRGFLTDL